MPLGDVVLMRDMGDDPPVTTQIWGKDFRGEMETIAPQKSSFFFVRAGSIAACVLPATGFDSPPADRRS
jgi:hypothetical protein